MRRQLDQEALQLAQPPDHASARVDVDSYGQVVDTGPDHRLDVVDFVGTPGERRSVDDVGLSAVVSQHDAPCCAHNDIQRDFMGLANLARAVVAATVKARTASPGGSRWWARVAGGAGIGVGFTTPLNRTRQNCSLWTSFLRCSHPTYSR